MKETKSETELKPLKITCTSTDCGNNLHCFRMTQKLISQEMNGSCRACGARLVDWQRVHSRNLGDVEYTFNALRFEMIRHHFWHVNIAPYAVSYARRKGRIRLRVATVRQLRALVGQIRHVREGYQTPRETSPQANAIHYAQHATASCCRACIAEWHGIPKDRPLTDSEIEYLADLALRYIDARIPDLLPEPVAVPPQRSTRESPRRNGLASHSRSKRVGAHAS